MTTIFFLLKISVTDHFKFVEKQKLGIDTILDKYKYNEILLRKIRNVLAHPPRSYKKDYGIWKNLFDNLKFGNKNKGIKPVKDFSKVINSDVGNIIFNGNYTLFTNEQMKDTLNYKCMKKIVDFIGTWLDKLTQEISNYF